MEPPPVAKAAATSTRATRVPTPSSSARPRRPGELTSFAPRHESYEVEHRCQADWDQTCLADQDINVQTDYPGMEACSVRTEVLHFNPSDPPADMSRNHYLWTTASVIVNPDGTNRFNTFHINARAAGSHLFFDRKGADFHFKVVFSIVPASFSAEDRDWAGCVARYQIPSAGAPDRRHACACVYRGDASNVQRCLEGSPFCDRAKLASDATVLQCLPDENACLQKLSGGVCPFDISRSFGKVSVPASPFCN